MKKIAFIVYYPYQWFIYKNIYKALPQEKRMVVVDLGAQPELQNLGVKSSITKLLDKEGVAYSIIEKSDYRKPFFFKSFFSNIEVIVSCWEIGCVGVNDAKDIKKICTTYGIAKELTLLRPSRSIYDIILAYGDRDQNYFSLLTKSLAIGNPRLDNYYTNQIDINKKIKFKDPSKKKILYVPTHGDIGSSEVMFETLKSLTAEYNIIFKPHYYSLREEVDIVNKYRSLNSIQVLDDSWDVIELMTEVDIIVSDNSSAIFDAMQVNKPIIVCDFLELDFIDIIHKNLRLVKRGVVGATTYSGSLEQEIKNKD